MTGETLGERHIGAFAGPTHKKIVSLLRGAVRSLNRGRLLTSKCSRIWQTQEGPGTHTYSVRIIETLKRNSLKVGLCRGCMADLKTSAKDCLILDCNPVCILSEGKGKGDIRCG